MDMTPPARLAPPITTTAITFSRYPAPAGLSGIEPADIDPSSDGSQRQRSHKPLSSLSPPVAPKAARPPRCRRWRTELDRRAGNVTRKRVLDI